MNRVIGYGKAVNLLRTPLMTQVEFAKRLGVSQPRASQLERFDNYNPKLQEIVRTAKILGVKPSELVKLAVETPDSTILGN